MQTDEEKIGNTEKLTNNVQYKEIIAAHFRRFSLDLSLCSPSSLNLTKMQLIDLLRQVEESLPSHLLELPQLKITLQACSHENDTVSASIQIFSLYSTTAMVSYKATITPECLSLGKIAQRSLSDIRKQSLHGADSTADGLMKSFVPSTPSKPVIYIVDDTTLIQKTLMRFLKAIDQSFSIRCFNDGNDIVTFFTGIDLRDGRPCSLIFMDLQMPNLDGIEATKIIREYEKKFRLTPIPIIAVSAQSNLSQEELIRAGFSGATAKPFTRASIEKVLEIANLYVKPKPPVQEQESDDHASPDGWGCRFC